MNRTKIDWADYSWNPVTGCRRDCFYCYACRMAQRLKGRYGYPYDDPFRPTWHGDRLPEPSHIHKPSRIFVCSQGELFAEGQDDWVREVLGMVKNCSQHQFLFLTKNYAQLPRWNPWPDNAWVGASATDATSLEQALGWLGNVDARVRFISLEPLLAPIVGNGQPNNWRWDFIDWLIIGAMTGPGAKRNTPRLQWIGELLAAARVVNIPVFMKQNLHQHFPGLILHQEFPSCLPQQGGSNG